VKRYNPAYDFYLGRYFEQGGIAFSDETTFDEVKPRWLLAERARESSHEEELFRAYVSDWRFHPEVRPCYYELFDRAVGGTGQPELARIRRLEAELPDSRMKLLFSLEDVAREIQNYYRTCLRDPLRDELRKGHGGREILKYFTTRELRSTSFGEGDSEQREATWNEAAGKLALWLDSVTAANVVADIQIALAEHENNRDHVNLPNQRLKPEERRWWCLHESELIKLSVSRRLRETRPTMMLTPIRGHEVAEYDAGVGRDILASPQYFVVERTDQKY